MPKKVFLPLNSTKPNVTHSNISLSERPNNALDLQKYIIDIININGGGSSSWNLTGNAGTNPSIDYIGTTDGQDFFLKSFQSFGQLAQLSLGASTPYFNLRANSNTYQANVGTNIDFLQLAHNDSGGTNGSEIDIYNDHISFVFTTGGSPLSYTFPNINGTGAMVNDGSGNLSWSGAISLTLQDVTDNGNTTTNRIDWLNETSVTKVEIDGGTNTITQYLGTTGDRWFFSDGDNNVITIGDEAGDANGTYLKLDDSDSTILVHVNSGFTIKTLSDDNSVLSIKNNIHNTPVIILGVEPDGCGSIGIYNADNTKEPISFNASSNIIIQKQSTDSLWFSSRATERVTKIGDSESSYNGNFIKVDDDAEIIQLQTSNAIEFTSKSSGNSAIWQLQNLTTDRALAVPNADGTIVLSVNNVIADTTGNINLNQTTTTSIAFGTSYVALTTDQNIQVTGSTGATSIDISGIDIDQTIIIKDQDGSSLVTNITIDSGTGNKIDNTQTKVMNVNFQSLTIKRISSTIFSIH